MLINFWISSISCLFFLPLTGNFCPWPRAVKPARFFVAGPAKKVQGLSNQYRHFKLFSISTGRNKPPGKISQSPRPRRPPQPPVAHTHSLCPGVSAPSPAPHPPASARGPRSRRPPEHPTAKALRAQPSARRPPAARGGSVITEPRGARRPPARKHAAGPGTGKSGGEPQRPQPRHAPALEPPASRGAYARLSQGPAVSSPPRTSHSESIAGPALGTAPASGPWGFRHHGTSRRQTPTSAQARRRAGNGEERGRTPAPATPPRSRSRAPSKPRGVRPPQSGAHGLL